MHDMSKAFDSINRATLIKDLEKILQKDELHLINTMLNVELSVKCGLHQALCKSTDHRPCHRPPTTYHRPPTNLHRPPTTDHRPVI